MDRTTLAPIAAIAALLLALGAPAHAAQTDYRNTDGGRPLRVADAVAVERFAFEVSLPWRFATGRGVSAHVLAPELEYGVARNLVVGLDLDIAAGGTGPGGESHVAASLFYNALRETPGWPALSAELEVGLGTAMSFPGDLGVELTGIASRSLGRSRLHANGALGIAPGHDGTGRHAHWWAGLAWDYTLYRASTLLALELTAEDGHGAAGAGFGVGAGVRRQVTPTLVLSAGIRQRLDDAPAGTELTLGLSHAFAIAGLMPGRRP